MAVDKLVDSTQLDADLTSVANAIRTKGGTSAQMAFPAGFVSAVQAIPTGGITPTGTKSITENGTYDVTQYASASVSVPNSYAAGDEGKVVSNGALVAQSSDTVTENDTYDTTMISSLTVNVSGGGSIEDPELKDVVFIDYDGEVVYNYTASEFLAMSAMPANPSHSGLVAQGWNWTIADAQEYVTKYGALVIGQNYTTSDGKTHIYLTLNDVVRDAEIGIYMMTSVKSGATIDWGDGASTVTTGNAGTAIYYRHTYANAGDYEITVEVTSGTVSFGYNGSNSTMFSDNSDAGRICASLIKRIEFGDGVTQLHRQALQNCWHLETVSIPQNLTYFGTNSNGSVFSYCAELKTVVFPPETDSTLQSMTFQNNFRCKFISFPKGITKLATSCLSSNLYAMRMLTFAELSLINVNNYNYQSLEKLVIPGTYANTGQYFARDCWLIRELTIPESVTSIADYALNGARNLKELHLKPTTPPTLANTRALAGTGDAIFYVPYSADHSILEAYQTATNWSSFTSRIQEESA